MTVLCKRLLSLISRSLGLEGDYLERTFGGGEEFGACLRANFYPKCPQPDLTLGLSAHSDPGFLTILLPDPHVSGLQVRHGDHWVTVKSIPDAFIVNLADQMQVHPFDFLSRCGATILVYIFCLQCTIWISQQLIHFINSDACGLTVFKPPPLFLNSKKDSYIVSRIINILHIYQDSASADTFSFCVTKHIQVVTNAIYRSVEHRVTVNSARERVSLAFFYNPKNDLLIQPAKELVTEDRPALYAPMTYEEYRTYIRTKGLRGKSQVESLVRLPTKNWRHKLLWSDN